MSFIDSNVTCVMRVMWVTRAEHERVEGHKHQSSSISKHYNSMHGKVSEDLLRRFVVLKKCRNKFDCLVHEMVFIRQLKPNLNVQSDSIRAKVFVRFFIFAPSVMLILAPTPL